MALCETSLLNQKFQSQITKIAGNRGGILPWKSDCRNQDFPEKCKGESQYEVDISGVTY